MDVSIIFRPDIDCPTGRGEHSSFVVIRIIDYRLEAVNCDPDKRWTLTLARPLERVSSLGAESPCASHAIHLTKGPRSTSATSRSARASAMRCSSASSAGTIRAGDRLVELQLAREFGSSQAPVREALRELEKAGLVTIRPRRGSFVNDYHARTQRELYYVRGALEEAAVRLAMRESQGRCRRALQGHLDGMREAARARDIEACLAPQRVVPPHDHARRRQRASPRNVGVAACRAAFAQDPPPAQHRHARGRREPQADPRRRSPPAIPSSPPASRASTRPISSSGRRTRRADSCRERASPAACGLRRRLLHGEAQRAFFSAAASPVNQNLDTTLRTFSFELKRTKQPAGSGFGCGYGALSCFGGTAALPYP